MCFPVVPDVVLPMDDIQGSILQGTTTGIVRGGANIVPGRVGGALHLNGIDQNVNFGPYTSACYHTFQECPGGVTWAMWLKLEGQRSSVLILDTGGRDPSSMGYCIWYWSIGIFQIVIKNTTHYHLLDVKNWELGQWVHLVFSAHPATSAAMYLNGCRVRDRPFRHSLYTRGHDLNRYHPFVIGSDATGYNYAVMDIDNLLIWYNILTPNDIWKLYLQGGDFWCW